LVLLAPTLLATGGFVLCREITQRFFPSLIGGAFLGFSSYMLAHARGGHLNLMLVFPIPLVAALVYREATTGGVRFLRLKISGLLVTQFLVSTEVFTSAMMFGGVALALAYVLAGAELRRRLTAAAASLAAAIGMTLLVVSPFLVAALVGPIPVHGISGIDTSAGSTDLANLVIPTPVTWLGGRLGLGTSRNFAGAVSGETAYLGPALIVMIFGYAREAWKTFSGQFLTAFLLISLVLSLGPELQVAGLGLAPLPARLLDFLPLVNKAIPGRFLLYGLVAISVMVAIWISRGQGSRRTLVAVLGLTLLLPAPIGWVWKTTPPVPAFFSSQSRSLGGRIVLPLSRTAALPMVWQAIDGIHFRMPIGYTGGSPEGLSNDVLAALYRHQCPPGGLVQALGFLRSRSVSVVVVDNSPATGVACEPPPEWVSGEQDSLGVTLFYREGIPSARR
jgi:hypothetical protein